jgi:AcrR family transcriptional regulator
MQSRCVLDAMASVVADEGMRGVTVCRVCEYAGVTSSVFRKLFPSLDACLLELQEQAMSRCTALVIEAFEAESSWRDGVLAGLGALLVSLERDPRLARVCLVESLAGSLSVHRRRLDLLAALNPLVDRAREHLPAAVQPATLTAEATVLSVAGVLHARLVNGDAPPYVRLLGELDALVVAPYFGSEAAASEMARGNARVQVLELEMSKTPDKRLVSIPKGLRHGKAARRRLCLAFVAENPGASNQAIAAGIDLLHLGQTSMALAGLEELGVLVKRAGGPGRHNAWSLSPYGEQVARALDHR